jgi:hypothetical protein
MNLEQSITLAEAEAYLADDDAENALRTVQSLLPASGDGWALAAEACEHMGFLEDATSCATAARARALSPEAADRLDRVEAALALYSGRPSPGPGAIGVIGALVGRFPMNSTRDDGPAADVALVQRVVVNLLRSDKGESLDALFEERAQRMMPGLTAAVKDTLDALGVEVSDDGEPNLVFIGGAAFSGAGVLGAMLSHHSRIGGAFDSRVAPAAAWLRNRLLDAIPDAERAAGLTEARLDEAVRAFILTALGGFSAGARLVDCSHHNTLYIELLGRIFPRARFIHVVRDGRAVTSALLAEQRLILETGEAAPTPISAEGAIKYWARAVAATRAQGVDLGARYAEIGYEDLITRPEAALRHVLAFLGESYEPRLLMGLTNLEPDGEGLSEADAALVAEIAGGVLRELRYR